MLELLLKLVNFMPERTLLVAKTYDLADAGGMALIIAFTKTPLLEEKSVLINRHGDNDNEDDDDDNSNNKSFNSGSSSSRNSRGSSSGSRIG